jgi:tetratricopeptide (TPR) repeat protein
MLPRLVVRLDEAIAREESPLARECLKAERAGVLARLGMTQEARFVLSGLRTQAQRHRSPRLHAWAWMVDGLISHFEAMGTPSREKFSRALSLATAVRDEPMMALSAAWLGACAFNAHDLSALSEHLGMALRLAAPDHHAVHARVGLILAIGFRLVGDEPRSRHWYQVTREHAGEDGDTSMMSAMLYNIAAMRAARIDMDDARGRACPDEVRRALLEAESTSNYDDGAGATARTASLWLVRAQLMLVMGRFDEALALFDAHRAAILAQGNTRRDARFSAERAWCHVRLGDAVSARQDLQKALVGLGGAMDTDDRFTTHARLAQVCAELGEHAELARQRALADEALLAHEAAQQALLAALQRAIVLAGLSP